MIPITTNTTLSMHEYPPHKQNIRGDLDWQINEVKVYIATKLPEGLFHGTSISACILVMKKNRKRIDVLFIDASGEEHYEKGKNQNKLREQDLVKIVETYENYEAEDKYSLWLHLKKLKKTTITLTYHAMSIHSKKKSLLICHK